MRSNSSQSTNKDSANMRSNIPARSETYLRTRLRLNISQPERSPKQISPWATHHAYLLQDVIERPDSGASACHPHREIGPEADFRSGALGGKRTSLEPPGTGKTEEL